MVHTYEEEAKRGFALRLAAAVRELKGGPEEHGEQKWLATQMGVSTKAVNKWFKGDSIPELAKLPKLAQILKKPAEYLLFGSAPQEVTYKQTRSALQVIREPRMEDKNRAAWIELWDEMSGAERHAVLQQIPITRQLVQAKGIAGELKHKDGGRGKESTHRKKS